MKNLPIHIICEPRPFCFHAEYLIHYNTFNLTFPHYFSVCKDGGAFLFSPDLLVEMLEILWVEVLGPAQGDYSPELDCWEYPGKHNRNQ